MGLALGDYDNDGRVDTFITNFSDDSNTLRRNLGDGLFEDVTGQARPADAVAAVSRMGHRIPRFRQRRLARSVRGQRPRLSAGRSLRLGHDLGAAPAAVSQSRGHTVRGGCRRRREAVLRSCNRRAARHSAISTTTAASTSSSTIMTTARRCSETSQRPAIGSPSPSPATRRGPRDAIGAVVTLEAGSAAVATRCRQRRQLLLAIRFSRAFRPGRNHPRGSHRRPVAGWQSRGVYRRRRRSHSDIDEGTGTIAVAVNTRAQHRRAALVLILLLAVGIVAGSAAQEPSAAVAFPRRRGCAAARRAGTRGRGLPARHRDQSPVCRGPRESRRRAGAARTVRRGGRCPTSARWPSTPGSRPRG